MNKLILASIFFTTLTLTACDKKTENNASSETEVSKQKVTLSKNVNADIKHDLGIIDEISAKKAEEALKFQPEVSKAVQNNNKAELKAIVEKMETYVDQFNDDLDKLPLKSTEGLSVKEKLKDANKLGLDLAEEGIKEKPDSKEINELQDKAIKLQHEILTEVQDLKKRTDTKS